MITATVRFKKNDLKRIANAAPDAADRAIGAIAQAGVNYVKENMGTSPAPPGGPPGVDTGTLWNAINIEPDGKLRRKINDGTDYGVFLELGSTRHSYVWPFFGPMAQWLEGEIPGLLDDFLL